MIYRLLFFAVIIGLTYYVVYLFRRDNAIASYNKKVNQPLRKQQDRGQIMAPLKDDDVYTFKYNDYYEEDTDLPYLASLGYEGGPISWQGITYGILKQKAPSLINRITFEKHDRELVISSFDRAALETISVLLGSVKGDDKLLKKAIHTAEKDGRMK